MSDKFIYALVGKFGSEPQQNIMLAEVVQTQGGNIPQYASEVVNKVQKSKKEAYQSQSFVFHVLTDEEYIFICVTESKGSKRLTFKFLDDLKNCFNVTFSEEEKRKAVEKSLTPRFEKPMAELMDKANKSEEKMKKTEENISETHQIAIQNLQDLFKRTEKLDIIAGTSMDLKSKTKSYKNTATDVKRQALRKKIFIIVISVVVGLVVLYLILGAACGFTFKQC